MNTPPLPRLPDVRQRYTLYGKIERARRKAVDTDVIELLDAFERVLQAVSMTAKGAVPDTRVTDVPDGSVTSVTTENEQGVTTVTDPSKKQAPMTPAEKQKAYRMRKARSALKDAT